MAYVYLNKGVNLRKLVFGVGVYEKGEYPSWVSDKMTLEYSRWSSMLKRCYSESYQELHKSYVGCSVSEDFLEFQVFAAWANKQVGFRGKDYQLDKDILLRGNKEYSMENCCFVPREINTLLMISGSTRDGLTQGVNLDKARGMYKATVGIQGKGVMIGRYQTADEAFCAFKYFKEARIKQLASLHKDDISPKVYETLMQYEVI